MLICFLTLNPHDRLIAKRYDQRSVIASHSFSLFISFGLCVICVHFISFIWIAFINCHQWQPIQKNQTNYLSVFVCIVQTETLKEEPQPQPQPKASTGKKHETNNHLNSVPHWIISNSGVGISACLCAWSVLFTICCLAVDADALHRFNSPLKSIWKWKILLAVDTAVYYFCCLFHSISLHLWM